MEITGLQSLVGVALGSYMRELKFRVCDGKDVYKAFDMTDMLHETTIPIEGWEGDMFFLQYTGLKDKNGVEIYEGDIMVDKGGYKWKLRWSNHRCGFLLSSPHRSTSKEPIMNAYNHAPKMEIIGNIYENADLLEK